MIANSMQSRFFTGNPLKHDAILAVYGEAEETGILAMQFMHFKFSVIVPVPEQFNFLEGNFL